MRQTHTAFGSDYSALQFLPGFSGWFAVQPQVLEGIPPSSGEDEEALLHYYRLLPDDSKREILQYLQFKFQQAKKQ